MKTMSNPARCMSGCPFPFYCTCSAAIIRYRAQYHTRYSHLLKSEHPSGEIKASEYGKWDSAANSKPANEPKFGVALTLLSRHPSTHCPARMIIHVSPQPEKR